ncbi:CPBP family intramembrane metalloprotease [Cytobacillus oceanisediminis]|uniref:CPBP family intramembrane glutamic endopeptidase n=1 Tax=Bacillaceae TaxID=186817 RepID=UPI0003329BCD|nr:CPBP family intramembrane glutamic endopeptidase [Cytobacillus oceanisediminis]EOR27200.1 CAAX amino terminal protease [Niallia nealsonii AAU1]MBZ9533532.1 CPBP family intramembrane metalloprotease [Cytobacillus oceanisediminis]
MYKNKMGKVRSGWIILLAITATMIAQMILSAPGMIIAVIIESQIHPNISDEMIDQVLDSSPLSLLSQGLGLIGGIAILFLLWKFVNKKRISEMGFKRFSPDFITGLGLGAVSIVFIFLILLFTQNIEMANSFASPDFSAYTLSYLLFFILVGFSEELTFRGYIMTTLADNGNSKTVVYIVSSLIFGVAHLLNPNVAVLGIINIFLVGLLFAYMYDKTKSLWMPIGYHITWNYFQGNVFGFPVSGTTPHGLYGIDVSMGNNWLTGGSFGLEGGLLATLMIVLGFVVTNLYTKKRVM